MKTLFYTVLLCVAALIIGGCTSTRYVPVETVRETTTHTTDTLRLVQLRVDTILERDSVAVIMRGDTVWQTRFRYRMRVQLRHDTVKEVSRDTVTSYIERPVPYPVEKRVEVEKRLTWWQYFRLRAFPWLAAATVLLSGWTLRKPLMRLIRYILKLIRL